MPYWQLFYHIIWTTKHRLPLLSPEVEPVIYGYVRGKAIGLGATVFALNGVADHVHLVAAIPSRIAVSRFIGQVKAVAINPTHSLAARLIIDYNRVVAVQWVKG